MFALVTGVQTCALPISRALRCSSRTRSLPSMGKTSFSMNIGEHVAIEQGLPVAVFSMEMGAVQLAMRMVGSVGMLDQHRMRTGKLTSDDWPRLTHAVQKVQEAQIYIDETPALS